MQKLRLIIAAVLVFCSSVAFAEPVNVNSASAELIAENLEGVGITKARAIVAYRNANGPFATPEALAEVTGIGPRTIEANRHNIVVEESGSDSDE
ncbi:MAG: helix-hairpin-helix domain-containing protein [Pseudomonadota bacterium]